MTRIPSFVAPAFWDRRFGSLSWERDRDFITRRILEVGDWRSVSWLRTTLGDGGLRAWLTHPARRSGGLSRRQIRFWEIIIATPLEHGRVNRVRVSFLEFRYPLLARTARWPKAGCHIASIRDIACMKLAAIAQRGSRKDFIDLWALLAHRCIRLKFRLERLLKLKILSEVQDA